MIRKNLITKTGNSIMKATRIFIYLRKKGRILICKLWLSDAHNIRDIILYFLTVYHEKLNYCLSKLLF